MDSIPLQKLSLDSIKQEALRSNSLPPEEAYKTIKERSCIVYVQNTDLAAALEAMDIPMRKDPPYSHRIEGGKRIVVWNMEQKSTCGRFQTIKLVKAWKRDLEFVLDPRNIDHPFRRIMMAFKNSRIMTDHILHKDKPYRVFVLEGGIKFYAKYGSRKYKYLVEEEGLTPI